MPSNRENVCRLLEAAGIDHENDKYMALQELIIDLQKYAYSQGWNDAYGLEGFHDKHNKQLKQENVKDFEL